jgi:plasmid stabilization system protein ParE
MKAVYTAAALADLAQIAEWLQAHYPAVAPEAERRIRSAVAFIERWPESARRSAKRPDVRVAVVSHHPYRIFYRVVGGTVEILRVQHTARRPWDEEQA